MSAVTVVGGVNVTVTVAFAVGVLVPSLAVNVYVVVAVGQTVVVPFLGTIPTPGVMNVEVQFVVVHESNDELPLAIDVGLAVNESMVQGEGVGVGVGDPVTFTVTEAVGVFVPSVAVRMNVCVEVRTTPPE